MQRMPGNIHDIEFACDFIITLSHFCCQEHNRIVNDSGEWQSWSPFFGVFFLLISNPLSFTSIS